jgi:Fis family transcriptional regulator
VSAAGSRRDGGRAAGESELRACVRRTLETYFDDLGDAQADDLFAMVLSEVEVPLLQVVLQHADGNQTRAARILGINRGTLRKKLGKYGLE